MARKVLRGVTTAVGADAWAPFIPRLLWEACIAQDFDGFHSNGPYHFNATEASPTRSGFYEIRFTAKDKVTRVALAWFDVANQTWFGNCIKEFGLRPEDLWWRGVVESIGRTRRVLLG